MTDRAATTLGAAVDRIERLQDADTTALVDDWAPDYDLPPSTLQAATGRIGESPVTFTVPRFLAVPTLETLTMATALETVGDAASVDYEVAVLPWPEDRMVSTNAEKRSLVDPVFLLSEDSLRAAGRAPAEYDRFDNAECYSVGDAYLVQERNVGGMGGRRPISDVPVTATDTQLDRIAAYVDIDDNALQADSLKEFWDRIPTPVERTDTSYGQLQTDLARAALNSDIAGDIGYKTIRDGAVQSLTADEAAERIGEEPVFLDKTGAYLLSYYPRNLSGTVADGTREEPPATDAWYPDAAEDLVDTAATSYGVQPSIINLGPFNTAVPEELVDALDRTTLNKTVRRDGDYNDRTVPVMPVITPRDYSDVTERLDSAGAAVRDRYRSGGDVPLETVAATYLQAVCEAVGVRGG
ncbi:MAG: hypothetical protein ABEI97_04005 [Candidatus Nanohaloarchaea archaeon]